MYKTVKTKIQKKLKRDRYIVQNSRTATLEKELKTRHLVWIVEAYNDNNTC